MGREAAGKTVKPGTSIATTAVLDRDRLAAGRSIRAGNTLKVHPPRAEYLDGRTAS